MVGLPIDESSDNLVAKAAAEAQLHSRIQTLKEQLSAAETALKSLKDGSRTNNSNGTDNRREIAEKATSRWSIDHDVIPSTTDIVSGPPVSKRGYLFKWNDRSIGWTGTKWGLRFVTLNGHLGQISYYGSHLDTQPRYVLSLRGCAVRDDGWKRNQRHKRNNKGNGEEYPPLEEPGAYFFLFSIYQRPYDERTNDADIVPLLRFSTPSLAEKTQWIQLISEACAYCETDEWLLEEAERVAELDKQQHQQRLMTTAMPEAKEGTLPPLIFAPHAHAQKTSKHNRRPSFNKTPSAANFRTKSKDADHDKSDAKSIKGYPPSKPMHRISAPSYLSVEAPVQNYRGFFNLGVIILIVANFRLLMGNVRKHGFVLIKFIEHIKDIRYIRQDPWEDFPFISGFSLQLVFITATFCIEWLLSRKRIPNNAGMFLHIFNAHAALLVPLVIVWKFIDKPAVGAVLLFHATITWMKLISYALANEDYRRNIASANEDNENNNMLALVENLDEYETDIQYPNNITMKNMIYYWFAPTLTYQIAFPKSPRVRWWKLVGFIMRMALCVVLFMFFAGQVVSPSLSGLVNELEITGGRYTISMMAEYWLRLTIANSYLWLLMFYFYFHLYLNFWAELLRFGDRVFYKDWWNSSEVSAYWRLWNMPVHYWLIRHVYFPCIRHKFNRTAATFAVFLLSAIMHEALVSVPFHMVRPWSFLGMMFQIPLVAITKALCKKFPGSSIGNFIFWLSFCVVGQPMAIMLYTVDYQYAKQHPDVYSTVESEVASYEQCSSTGMTVNGEACFVE